MWWQNSDKHLFFNTVIYFLIQTWEVTIIGILNKNIPIPLLHRAVSLTSYHSYFIQFKQNLDDGLGLIVNSYRLILKRAFTCYFWHELQPPRNIETTPRWNRHSFKSRCPPLSIPPSEKRGNHFCVTILFLRNVSIPLKCPLLTIKFGFLKIIAVFDPITAYPN